MAKQQESGLFLDELPRLKIGSLCKGGRVVAEYDRFYVVDFGKYKEAVSRIDIALEEVEKNGPMNKGEFVEKLLAKDCIIDDVAKVDAENYISLMGHDAHRREGGAIKQKRWGK